MRKRIVGALRRPGKGPDGQRVWRGLRSETGFTIIEVVIAMTLLSVVLFAVAGLVTTGIKVITNYNQRNVALNIATGIFDQERQGAALASEGSCSFASAVESVAGGPAGFWALDDVTTTVTDSVSSGPSGTIVGSPNVDVTPGPLACDANTSGSLQFPSGGGASVQIAEPSSSTSPFGSSWSPSSLTVMAWIRLTATPAAANLSIVGDGSPDSTKTGFDLGIGNSSSTIGTCELWNASGFTTGDEAYFEVGNSAGHETACVPAGSITPDGMWEFLVGTYNGSTGTASAYINGVLTDSVTDGLNSNTSIGSSSFSGGNVGISGCNTYIGAQPVSGCGSQTNTMESGNLGQVAVFSGTALTGSQVQTVSAAMDFPPAGLPESATPTASWCPFVTCSPIVQTEGNFTFRSYVTGGWCIQSGTGWTTAGSGAITTPPYPSYLIAVKVAWGPQSSQTKSAGVTTLPVEESVVFTGLIPTPSYDEAIAPSTGPLSSCPIGTLS